jgi:hypothetical protein
MSVEKLRRGGKVAVMISPGYGAGWSTWNSEEYKDTLLFDKEIAEAVLAGSNGKAAELAEIKCPGVYLGGRHDLKIVWLDEGESFVVSEYDGSESIQTKDGTEWATA